MRNLARILVCSVIAVVAVWVISGSEARDAHAAASGGDEARKRMDRGQQLFAQGKYQEAMVEFEAAYKAQPYGAFLFNAAFAAEKAGDRQRAIARYNEYLASDPNAPDADGIRATVKRLEEELSKVPPATESEDGDEAAGGAGGGESEDDGTEVAAPVPADEETLAQMRSLVLIESEPPGAPLSIYERIVATADPFKAGEKNVGWRKVVSKAKTPHDLSLRVGHYQVVIEAFQDFKRSETSINLAPGHVYTFKANLSQGEFLAFLRVNSKVEGAKIFLDDPPPHKSAPWGRTPGAALVNTGDHEIWVEKPGYEPFSHKLTLQHGETAEIEAKLKRVDYGYLIIDGNAGAIEIEVDEKPQGVYRSEGDPIKIKLPAGNHALMLDADGRKTYEGQVVVPRGQELPLHATLTESYPRGKAVALGILSAAAIGGGVFMHLQAEKPIGQPHNEDIHNVFNYGRYGAWGLGGLLAGLSIFYSIYDPYPDPLLKRDKARDFPETDAEEASREEKNSPKKSKKKEARHQRPLFAPFAGSKAGGLMVIGAF